MIVSQLPPVDRCSSMSTSSTTPVVSQVMFGLEPIVQSSLPSGVNTVMVPPGLVTVKDIVTSAVSLARVQTTNIPTNKIASTVSSSCSNHRTIIFCVCFICPYYKTRLLLAISP